MVFFVQVVNISNQLHLHHQSLKIGVIFYKIKLTFEILNDIPTISVCLSQHSLMVVDACSIKLTKMLILFEFHFYGTFMVISNLRTKIVYPES